MEDIDLQGNARHIRK